MNVDEHAILSIFLYKNVVNCLVEIIIVIEFQLKVLLNIAVVNIGNCKGHLLIEKKNFILTLIFLSYIP